jgi:hypothetical protein
MAKEQSRKCSARRSQLVRSASGVRRWRDARTALKPGVCAGLSPAGRRSSRRPVSSWCVAIEEEVQRILARSAGLDRCAPRCVAWAGRGIGARHPASSGRSGAGEQGALAPGLSECLRCGELLSVGTSTRRVSRRLSALSRRAPASSIAPVSRAPPPGLPLGRECEREEAGPARAGALAVRRRLSKRRCTAAAQDPTCVGLN